MSATAVSLQGLSKVYRLYHHPRDRLKEALDPRRRRYHQDFYALRDVDLAVRPGESVGVIGRNGSGKSTLLKIIAGILTPTAGAVRVHGRLSALLELGAGFNPELSGLANVYFSGTLMGYSRAEMANRLPAIREFADIGDYLDQPVRTYSSGMFVRLAFATAVNVDPDILIIDEALAVGDLGFQARCFRKFNEFRAAGKTIIFVTHALDTVIRYCDRALVLERGRQVLAGAPRAAVDAYKQLLADCYAPEAAPAVRPGADPTALSYGDRRAEITHCEILDATGRPARLLHHAQPCTFRLRVRFRADLAEPIFAYALKDLKGLELTGTNTLFKQVATGCFRAGEEALVEFRQTLNLQSGRYSLSLGCTGYEGGRLVVYHRLYDALLFEVLAPEPMTGFFDLQSAITVSRETGHV